MPATIPYSKPRPVKPRPVPTRHGPTLNELLRRAAASVDREPVKLISGRFRPEKKGRALTRTERGLIGLMVGGLGLAVWLHALPAPVRAHTTFYQSLTASTPLVATAPRPYVESALLALGRDWRPATLFACVHPAFWSINPAVGPNALAERVERGLKLLAEHGPVVSVMTFPAPASVETETVGGADVLAAHLSGQLELTDGAVARFTAHLVQDGSTGRWGLVEVVIPGFLP